MNVESPPRPPTVSDAAQTRLITTLTTIDFPATKDDLLRIAVLDHLEVVTISALRELPRRDYHGAAEILKALRVESHRDARAMAPADA